MLKKSLFVLGALLLLAMPAKAGETLTTEDVRAQVQQLLTELDGFKDTKVFHECVYGCGQRNPGAAWIPRRKKLHEQMSPQLDVPVLLQASVGDLWALGMAYAKGRAGEARELREDIERALKQ